MKYEHVPPRRVSDSWLVEAVSSGPPIGGGNGEIASALFYGIDAEARARVYAALMNGLAAKRLLAPMLQSNDVRTHLPVVTVVDRCHLLLVQDRVVYPCEIAGTAGANYRT